MPLNLCVEVRNPMAIEIPPKLLCRKSPRSPLGLAPLLHAFSLGALAQGCGFFGGDGLRTTLQPKVDCEASQRHQLPEFGGLCGPPIYL